MYWMKLKQTLLFTASSLLILASASSQAGRQGIDFYYGLGLGAAQPADVDVSAIGEIILGIEEDGWAIEGIAYSGLEAGTDVTNFDYSLSGTEIGLAYRTIEKNNRYYKIKYSRAEMDFETTNTATDASQQTKPAAIPTAWAWASVWIVKNVWKWITPNTTLTNSRIRYTLLTCATCGAAHLIRDVISRLAPNYKT